MAKPRKLCPEMVLAIAEAVRKVHHYDDACALVGIAFETLRAWIRQADIDERAGLAPGFAPGESPFLSLSDSVKTARADVKAQLLEVVREAGTIKREWLPALSYLGRMDHRWERNTEAERGPVSITFNVRYTPRVEEGQFTVIPSSEDTVKALPEPAEPEDLPF